jgi:hypothetical protein
LQSISGGNAINPLVTFYDIHRRKKEVLFFFFVPDTTRHLGSDYKIILLQGVWYIKQAETYLCQKVYLNHMANSIKIHIFYNLCMKKICDH